MKSPIVAIDNDIEIITVIERQPLRMWLQIRQPFSTDVSFLPDSSFNRLYGTKPEVRGISKTLGNRFSEGSILTSEGKGDFIFKVHSQIPALATVLPFYLGERSKIG
jgi:hypothetical protein